MDRKIIITFMMIFVFILTLSSASAFTAEEQKILDSKYDFYPSDFIFEYNGYNSTS